MDSNLSELISHCREGVPVILGKCGKCNAMSNLIHFMEKKFILHRSNFILFYVISQLFVHCDNLILFPFEKCMQIIVSNKTFSPFLYKYACVNNNTISRHSNFNVAGIVYKH